MPRNLPTSGMIYY